MAVNIVSRPDDFSSAYTPVEYVMDTTFANVNTTISNIFLDTDGRTTVVLPINRVSRRVKEGGILTLTNTPLGTYDGEFTVTNVKSDGSVSIDTPFLGNSIGGNATYARLNAHIICDLYIDGSFIVRRTRFPDSNQQMVFNFDREVQINLGNDLSPVPLGTNARSVSPESSASISIKYADSQDIIVDGIAIPTLSLDTSITPNDLFDDPETRIIINSTVPYLEWELGSTKNEIINSDIDLSSFIIATVASNRFLTNSPKTISIGTADSYQLSAIIDYDASILYRREVIAYNSAGAIIATTRGAFTPATDSVWIITCGTRDLPASQVPSGAARYEVSIVDGNNSNAKISEVINFNVDRKCHGTKTRFVWLNPRGGYDAFNFHSPRKLNSSVSKKSFNPARVYPVVVGNSEERILDVRAQDNITTKTAKITTSEAEWLQELLESPEVFLELDEANALHGNRIPIIIVNKTRAISDSYNSLHNISLRYRFAFEKKQLRAS